MLVALLLLACAPEPESTGPIDARAEIPEPPAGGAQFIGGERTVPPMSEAMFCTFFTWEGGDIGVRASESYQDDRFGHHAVLLITHAAPQSTPDGSVLDCTDTAELDMVQSETFYVPRPVGPGRTSMQLPEGMAVRLEAGTRLVLQSHYVNYEDRPLTVQDGVNLDLVPPDEVLTWAASFAHTTLDIEIPPGEEAEAVVECSFESQLEILYLIGHMHEQGTSFAVDHNRLGGEADRIYDVAQWYDYHRDVPPVVEFEPGELVVEPGESFTTTCRWDNQTDETLRFPHEMCAAVGIAYPSSERLYCGEL